ncbi:HbrB-like protein [Cordyceps fumosorosea ARSEF 2679]|uniref:HbrB-like protein n=1 Tax=Cordyceps fumosorosea (strain ARSEF 2679) TaxID=1081104 RepID=A0A167WN87_CORFA|nr:HbrB-like protein [Cordyceps fumosorosea ARSEF 2679]OAA64003.1 HbrB-like protein [Cordyceps fumosorosea ARSEF 2679]
MQPAQGSGAPSSSRQQGQRAPGSFSPLTSSAAAATAASPSSLSTSSAAAASAALHGKQPRPTSLSRRPPPPLRLESSEEGAASSSIAAAAAAAISSSSSSANTTTATTGGGTPSINVGKSRQRVASPATPIYAQFTSHPNNSSSSLHSFSFSRPNPGSPRVVTHGSPSTLHKGESRKHSATQGMFEPSLPSTTTSNLSQVGMSQPQGQGQGQSAALSASQIAAQAAVMSHQNTMHSRQRSQTVPVPGEVNDGPRRGSGSRVPTTTPPTLSLTEASAPRDSGFGPLGGLHISTAAASAATTAANVVFPRSGHNSPRDANSPQPVLPLPPPIPAAYTEKPLSKSEKAKAKLFSRPVKMSAAKADGKDKALPSPSKIGSALSALQRGNFSTTSLADSSAHSLYSLTNSSSATIRPAESANVEEKAGKEKRHHFLSRQKQKLKDEYHLPLSSAASNSRPTDPNAPSSLYNFHLPSSVGLSTSGFSKARKDKKHGERSDSRQDNESSLNLSADISGTVPFPSLSQQSTIYDTSESARLGLNIPSSLDEAWPYLKSLLSVVFQGEDLRLPVEDINRIVHLHIQYCVHKRSPLSMLDDLRELLAKGFSSLDHTLRQAGEDRFIPTLVELWLFTFTSILPYLQAVFVPLELEVAGRGTILNYDQARDFWGSLSTTSDDNVKPTPPTVTFDIRRLVLAAYRDTVILPRYETLKTIFSRLSLEFLPSSFANMALSSPSDSAAMSTSPPEYFPPLMRPGTSMSHELSVGSYNSNSTTLLGDDRGSAASGGRSRAVSNVSYGSNGSGGAGVLRPFTPSSAQVPVLSSVREQNVEDSKQVTDMVGRMLQCVSVLASLVAGGVAGGAEAETEADGDRKMAELCRMLKLNWLGRGRTGRNRRGLVGGRVRRDEEVRVV